MLLYINDFLSSPFVHEMNDSQRVWYIWLLMRAWQSSDPCFLENDDEKLRINAGCKSKAKWRKHKQLVLNCFTHDEAKNSLTHWRLLDQYEEMMESVERKRLAGIASATARQHKATAVEQPSTLQIQTHIHTKEPKATPAQALPDWIPVDTWKAFTEMRRKIRKPLTDHAAMLMFKKLENLQTRGHPVQAVLEQSIVNDWQDVFELRNGNQTAPSTKMKSAVQVMKERNEQG